MPEILSGNAQKDGIDSRGWIVGSFMPEGLSNTEDVEIKWGVHPQGQERKEWVTDEKRTTISILVSGNFDVQFVDKTVTLAKPGDYVMWGEGIDHRWRAEEDSVVMTVRWNPTK